MASPPLEFLTGKIVSIIENEVSLLGGVRDEYEEIKRELLAMKAFFADAERKGALSELEKAWVEAVRDVSIDLQDVIEEFTYQMNKRRSWGPYTRAFRQMICFPKNLWDKHQIATRLQKIIKTTKAIPETNKRYGVDHVQGIGTSPHYDPNRVRIHGESSLFFKDDELVGIREAKEKLVGWLLSGPPQRSVISVVGMGGSGKTTLVANTFKSQTVKNSFACYAWITVSQNYNIEDLLRAMIKELFRAAMEATLDITNMSYVALVEMLINYLQPKRYLIVLDDVWDIDLWKQVHTALPDGAHGSRVMLTTRNEDIATFSFSVGSRVHRVQPLNEKEAWDLFSLKAFSSWHDSCCPQELHSIARDIVGKCQGLPLGIVAIGALLSTKRLVSEWTIFYSTLNWELSNNPTLEVVKSILLLSFNDLPYRLKNCVLYFCIFPEDYVVSLKKLIRLLIAEGFVDQVPGAKPEETAECYVAELIRRCMLQVDREPSPSGIVKNLKMHDLVRELALAISEAEKFCTVYNGKEATTDCQHTRRLSMQANYGKAQLLEHMSKVRTLFVYASSMADSSSVEKLLSGVKLLRVLDLENLPLTKLPDEIMKCYNLKYLCLKNSRVKELPKDIGNLHNLETLDIRHSKIRLLPIGMVKLKNLRHLLMWHYLEGDSKFFSWFEGTKVPFDISKLENLQLLYGIEAGGMLIRQLGHLTQLRKLFLTSVRDGDEKDLCKSIESMKLIEFLDIKTSNEDEVLRLDALPSAPPLLKKLVLTGKLEKVPHWFQSLESLTDLHLRCSSLTDDILPFIHTLPNLSRLQLASAHVGNQLVFHTGFQKLTDLNIHNFPQLNVITIEPGVMPALHILQVSHCAQLKQLPHGIEHLTCLQKFYLRNVPNELIQPIQGEGSLDRSKVKHIPDIRYFWRDEKSQWVCYRL